MRISIIGSAGRNDDKDKLDMEVYYKMYNTADIKLNEIIKEYDLNYKDIELISGGSSYADHIAIYLYFKYHKDGIKLTLHLPYNFVNGSFTNKTLNNYHEIFSTKCSINSLLHIQVAITSGAKYYVHNGYHDRNLYVGNTDYLIAFTFAKNGTLKPGGTKHTWDNSSCKNKIHYDIASL